MPTKRILTLDAAGAAPAASAVALTSETGTQTTAKFAAETTNAGMVLAPNGTGALMAQQPDGTGTGGNARGTYATDWQRTRLGDAARVASGNGATVSGGIANSATGQYATVAGGYANRALISEGNTINGGFVNAVTGAYDVLAGGQSNASDGNRSVVGGGQENYVTNAYSMVPGGYRAWAFRRGEFAFASGGFAGAAVGQAQTSIANLRSAWVNAAGGTTQELFTDGEFNTTTGLPTGTTRFYLPNQTVVANTRSVLTFHAQIAVIDTVTGDTYCATAKGALKNYQGTCSLIGSVIQDNYFDAGAAGWSVSVDAVSVAGTEGKALRVRVTTAGNTNWIKATATIWGVYMDAFRGTLYP